MYSNLRSLAGRAYSRDLPVRPSLPVEGIASVEVESKQCDTKASDDAFNFGRARALQQRQRFSTLKSMSAFQLADDGPQDDLCIEPKAKIIHIVEIACDTSTGL